MNSYFQVGRAWCLVQQEAQRRQDEGAGKIKEKQVSFYILSLQFYRLPLHPSLPKLIGSSCLLAYSFFILAVLLPFCPSVGWLVFRLDVVDPNSVGWSDCHERAGGNACMLLLELLFHF